MKEFIVDLSRSESYSDFVAAFNEGFCRYVSGEWNGQNWNAFHDYLSWPNEESYCLTFHSWKECKALSAGERAMIEQICLDNPHVHVAFT